MLLTTGLLHMQLLWVFTQLAIYSLFTGGDKTWREIIAWLRPGGDKIWGRLLHD
jgi:hypothetical protein